MANKRRRPRSGTSRLCRCGPSSPSSSPSLSSAPSGLTSSRSSDPSLTRSPNGRGFVAFLPQSRHRAWGFLVSHRVLVQRFVSADTCATSTLIVAGAVESISRHPIISTVEGTVPTSSSAAAVATGLPARSIPTKATPSIRLLGSPFEGSLRLTPPRGCAVWGAGFAQDAQSVGDGDLGYVNRPRSLGRVIECSRSSGSAEGHAD